MRGTAPGRLLALAVLAACVLAAGCTGTKTSQTVSADTARLVTKLSREAFVCGASLFYPGSPGVHICAKAGGGFDEQVAIVGHNPRDPAVSATLTDPNNHNEPTAGDVDAAYGPIVTNLFRGDAADKAAKWLHAAAAGGGHRSLSFNGPDASNPDGPDEIVLKLLAGDLTIFGAASGAEFKPGKLSALPDSIDELQQYGEGDGMICRQRSQALDCNGNTTAPAKTIGLRGILVSGSEGGHPTDVQLVVNGPPDTSEDYAVATASAARPILQQALGGASQNAEVDRIVRWIKSEGDARTHSMVFAGLSVTVTAPAQQPIEAENLLIQPMHVWG